LLQRVISILPMSAQGHFRQIDTRPTLPACPLRADHVRISRLRGRAGNKLWDDGWGWSWFDAANPSKTTSTEYKTNCRSCHVPAQGSDWIYVKRNIAFLWAIII
jgi:hypothetical protein